MSIDYRMYAFNILLAFSLKNAFKGKNNDRQHTWTPTDIVEMSLNQGRIH